MTDSDIPPAIVLAAGGSRRLGEAKQLARVGGETLLERTIRVVREADFGTVLVVLGARRDEIAARVDLSGVRVIVNPAWEQGIASSIQAGIRAVLESHPESLGVLLLVCDQPMLQAEHLRALVAGWREASSSSIAASSYAGVAGVPAIFPASEFEHLTALRGDVGARALLIDPQCPLIAVPFAGGAMDVDTPGDLAEAARVLSERAGEL